MKTKNEINRLTFEIIGAAIEVHKQLGPGLLESIYQKCLAREFTLKKINFSSQLNAQINYKDISFESELRCDFLVENAIIVELKSAEKFIPIYEAQILSYMRLLNIPKGVLINFNCTNIFEKGQQTYVNDIFHSLES